jgi:cytochrome b561
MNNTFSRGQILFHWLVFLLVVVTYAAMELKGFAAKGTPAREALMLTHYTAGLSVLILMVIRMGLKLVNRDPDIIPTPPRWQVVAAKALHGVLYLMFLALPVLGVLTLYFGQVSWSFFGIALPVDAVGQPDLKQNMKDIHEFIANTGYFVVGAHAAAALFHHYVVRDNTLFRILPVNKLRK